MARLAYHSKSDGSWRITPHVEMNGRLSKGAEVHYTQETKPHLSIVFMLDDLKEKSLEQGVDTSASQMFKMGLFETFLLYLDGIGIAAFALSLVYLTRRPFQVQNVVVFF